MDPDGWPSYLLPAMSEAYFPVMQLCMQRVKAISQLADPFVEMRH
jgi:hypothetical protein